MSGRQFIKCAFSEKGGREYTYHFDGPERPPLGARMKVQAKDGVGWTKVWVTGFAGGQPTFPTKAAELYPLTEEELEAAEAKSLAEEGPGFDD